MLVSFQIHFCDADFDLPKVGEATKRIFARQKQGKLSFGLKDLQCVLLERRN